MITAEQESGSEAVLELPALGAERVKGRTVLIVRGEGGRELLGQALEERGADVQYLEVYRRYPIETSLGDTLAAAGVSYPDIIVLTSAEATDHLADLMIRQEQRQLFHCAIVTISERVAERARLAGFGGPIEIAAETSDAGLHAAIVRAAASRRHQMQTQGS